jgi:hypothetical protein
MSTQIAAPTTVYIKHDDPGHGWLAVPVADLIDLGIHESISPYSYISRDKVTVYLEEDCDMSAFYTAYIARYGEQPRCKTVHTNDDSFVRFLRHVTHGYWKL